MRTLLAHESARSFNEKCRQWQFLTGAKSLYYLYVTVNVTLIGYQSVNITHRYPLFRNILKIPIKS